MQWLAYLAIEEGILDSAKCLVLKHAIGPDADILSFGEKLLDRGYCQDFDQLQELVNDAYQRAEAGQEVPANPFEVLSTTRLSMKRRPSNSESSSSTLNPTTAEETKKPAKPDIAIPASLSKANSEPAKESKPQPKLPSLRSGPDSSFSKTKPQAKPIAIKLDDTKPGTRSGPTSPQVSAPLTRDPLRESAPHLEEKRVSVAEHTNSSIPARKSLSNERPPIDIDVPDEWPDFGGIGSMSVQDTRQWMVQLLLKCQTTGASDLHICADARPFIRYNRNVTYLGDHVFTPEEADQINKALLSDFQINEFDENQDLDYALSLDLHLRYRVNLMVHKDGTEGTYRIVPNEVQSLEELGFAKPETIRKLLSYHNGLIMVTGPMGSGKTATLAALVDELNRTRQDHLITVESPIEIVQHSEQCQITQREVGSHTKTFQSALKGALRQDPDIIVIGEMRDLETVEMAISASETGHLVIGTMHTSDAANTLNRLLDVFPAAQQTQIRSMVAESLRGIVCQRLLPANDGGVALAYELLLNNAAVGNLIRSNKADGLSNIIETGRSEGMILMDKSIFALWEANLISDEVALANLVSRPMKQQILQSSQTTAST